MNANARESELVDHAPPLYLRVSEVDEQGQVETRCLQVVDALRQVLVREVLDAFHLDKQAIFDQQIRRIRADVLALVGHREGRLGLHPQTAKTQFLNEC